MLHCTHINFLIHLAGVGVASCSHVKMPGPVLKMRVRPGDNITLYCDCKFSTGVYINWYRNSSHENHTTLLLAHKGDRNTPYLQRYFPNFHYLRNFSSKSYDLLILNITDADEGLYYCGTEEPKVEYREYIEGKTIYSHGNRATRIICGKFSLCKR